MLFQEIVEMVRIIINIVLLVILAIFVALNMPYKTGVNIFGWKLEEISVVAVMIISLVVGVLYSFSFYVTSYLSKASKKKIKLKSQITKEKEKELLEREKNVEVMTDEVAPQPELIDEPKKKKRRR